MKTLYDAGKKAALSRLNNGSTPEELRLEAADDVGLQSFRDGWMSALTQDDDELILLAEANQPSYDKELDWNTYEQWQDEGFHVVAGEKCTRINGEPMFSRDQVSQTRHRGRAFYWEDCHWDDFASIEDIF